MTRYEIAHYAALLPTPAARDKFADFALHAQPDAVRRFVRYQLQMMHRGFRPAANVPGYRRSQRAIVLPKKSEAA